MIDVLSAGIIVADHVCTPIAHLPAAGELVMADGMLLTIGGCAANAAVDLAKMDARVAIVVRAKGEYLSQLDRLLPHVDVFLPNNLEAEIITGVKDPLKQAEVFQRLGAGTTIVTMGGDGAILVQKDLRLRAGTYAVRFVD